MSFYFARAFRQVKNAIGAVKQLKNENDIYIKKLQNNESLKDYNKNIESNPFYWLYKTKVFVKEKISNVSKSTPNLLGNDKKKSTTMNEGMKTSDNSNNSNLEKSSSRLNNVIFHYFIFIHLNVFLGSFEGKRKNINRSRRHQ